MEHISTILEQVLSEIEEQFINQQAEEEAVFSAYEHGFNIGW